MIDSETISRRTSKSSPNAAAGELELLVEQLREAYPTASDKMLIQAITASREEIWGLDDRERLIRCVCERITA